MKKSKESQRVMRRGDTCTVLMIDGVCFAVMSEEKNVAERLASSLKQLLPDAKIETHVGLWL